MIKMSHKIKMGSESLLVGGNKLFDLSHGGHDLSNLLFTYANLFFLEANQRVDNRNSLFSTKFDKEVIHATQHNLLVGSCSSQTYRLAFARQSLPISTITFGLLCSCKKQSVFLLP